MLNPKKKNEHLIYGDILTPPAESPILERAITTTYSLDISALVSCMIPLAFSDDVNSRLFQNKVSTLTALRNLSEKLIVFCDPGQIKRIKTRNQEFAILLEKMIVPVMLEKVDNVYPAFHPKMWLLQFTNSKKEHSYRLIVLSRNISYDRCYDVSLVLESYNEKRKKGVTEQSFKKTRAVLDYLEYLNNITEKSDSQDILIRELLSEIQNEQVGFKIDSQVFDAEDWDIYPIYANTLRKDRKLFEKIVLNNKDGYKKILVMSPFISKDILEKLQSSLVQRKTIDKKIKLITRQDAVNRLNAELLPDFDLYVLNPNVISGEEAKLDDNPEEDQEKQLNDEISDSEKLHDIHAKIFLTESKEENEFFIGSANATNSAFNRNNELVVRLKSTSNQMSVDSFFKEINTDKGNMFVPAELSNAETSDQTDEKEVEAAIREISHITSRGKVIKKGDKYTVEINFEYIPDVKGVNISISPISVSLNKAIEKQVVFEEVELENISEFYSVSAEKLSSSGTIKIERLLKIPTDNIPYEERDSLLVNQVITDKESFTEYVTLLLSSDSISTQLELTELNQSAAKWKITNTQMPLYETLLKASVANPRAVLNLGKDMELINNKEIVTDEFMQLYKEFKKAIEN